MGQQSWTLKTKDLLPVDAYRIFCEEMIGYPLATRKRYAEALSSFLDYLYEANVFGDIPVSAQYINSVFNAYPLLLRDGSEAIAAKVRLHIKEAPHQLWLAEVAEALNLRPIAPNSFSNTLAPINRFLRRSERLSQEELERATAFGILHQGTSQSLINALAGASKLSSIEISRMRQNSMFGNVVKFVGKNIKRPNRIVSKEVKGLSNERYLDFPFESIKPLIDAATSWRDKSLWLLLAASGIRTSEARNILLDDIDFERQEIYIFDPKCRRYSLPGYCAQDKRFKGRQLSSTYLFEPLRSMFFQALQNYLNLEYIPTGSPNNPRYLFQYMDHLRRGQPLVNASDAAMGKSFKKAIATANIPIPFGRKDWTLHSLRHLYGVYMLNEIPINSENNIFGLDITEVQMLMGHKNINQTKHYARSKENRLMRKLKDVDEKVFNEGFYNNNKLSPLIIERIKGQNDKYN